jgi:hypothetical protein
MGKLSKWVNEQLCKYYIRKWYRYKVKTEELRQKSLKYWDLTRPTKNAQEGE